MAKKVIIIGAGIVGLSTAYYLNKSGFEVEIIDQTDGSDNCSYGNAGYVAPSHLIPLASPGIINQGLKWMINNKSPFYIKPRMDFDLLKWAWLFKKASTDKRVKQAIPILHQLTTQSQLLYEELMAQEGIEAGYAKQGLLMVCQTEKALAHELELVKVAKKFDLKAAQLSRQETESLEPNIKYHMSGAVYFDCDGWMTPQIFMEQFKKCLKKKGVLFHYNSSVNSFVSIGKKITELKTTKGDFSADEFVITAGAWTGQLMKKLGVFVPLEAGKGYSFMMKPDQSPKLPSILVEGKVATTPMLNGLRVAGTMEMSGINHKIGQHRVDGIIEALKEAIPEYERYDFSKVEPWTGLRPCSPDGLPYIGRTHAAKNLTLGTGHAMLGWTLGPITGKIITESILDKPSSLKTPLLAVDRYHTRTKGIS